MFLRILRDLICFSLFTETYWDFEDMKTWQRLLMKTSCWCWWFLNKGMRRCTRFILCYEWWFIFHWNLNLDVDKSTVFVAGRCNWWGYIKGKWKVEGFVEESDASERVDQSGFYKFYKRYNLPMRLPISIEYDILPNMELI